MTAAVSEAVRAIRERVALSRTGHVSVSKLDGPDAFAALDRVVAADLFLRDGQMLQSLLLDAEGRPRADVYVARDDESAWLLGEWVETNPLGDWLRDHAAAAAGYELTDLGLTHVLFSINGPYAWELLAAWAGDDVVGIPYLSLFRVDAGICFRAGKTGEYGFDLLVANERADAVWTELVAAGRPFEAVEAGLDALDLCALENGFFDVRHGAIDGLTPVELQQQWRLSSTKDYLGSTAVRARRALAPPRVTCFVSNDEVAAGDAVWLGDACIGTVRLAARSPSRGDVIGQALLERRYAHAGITELLVHHAARRVPIATVSAPFLDNRSIHVDPRRHSYRFHADDVFPPLVPARTRWR